MKKLFILLYFAIPHLSSAQYFNSTPQVDEHKNLVYFNFGYDFGVTTQLGYGRQVTILRRSTLLNVDASIAMGKDLTDDFKVRYGGQMQLATVGHFAASVRIYSITRGHHTSLVRMTSFGTELSALVGYYKPQWYFITEFGFDKAIATHVKNGDTMIADYPLIQDGWYMATGGSYFFGLTIGKSVSKKLDCALRFGGVNAQGSDKNPVLPYYIQAGVIRKF